jgi:general secretion pathway protein D
MTRMYAQMRRLAAAASLLGLAGCATAGGGEPMSFAPRTGEDGRSHVAGLGQGMPDPTERRRSFLGSLFGTGQYVSQPGFVLEAAAAQRGAGEHSLDLVEASVTEAAQAVLGEILQVNYTVDPRIDSPVTIRTATPVDARGVAELFEAALRTIGAVVVKNGEVYRVVTADQAAMGARIGEQVGVGNSTVVVQLRHIAPVDMQRILEPLSAFGGVVEIDESRGALLLSGTREEIASMRDAISVFDVNAMRGKSIAVVPIDGVEPEAILPDLQAAFAGAGDNVSFVPNNSLDTILIVASQPEYLTDAQTVLHHLTAQATGGTKRFYTYHVRNRPAAELLEVLSTLFASEMAGAALADAADAFAAAPALATDDGAAAIAVSAPAGATDRFAAAFQPPGRGAEAFASVPLGITAGTASLGRGRDGEPRIKMVVDPGQNALLVLATREDYERVQQVIARLDVIPSQVLIEATIAEVSLNDDLRFGVRWLFESASGDARGSFSDLVSGAVESAFPGFSFLARSTDWRFVLNALSEVGRVDVLASPSLMVVDSRTATLQIGDQVPITTQTARSIEDANAAIVNAIAYRDAGIILSITPRINESGRILLDIEQEVSNVQRTTTSGIDSPTFGRRSVKTTVVVNDGEVLTLGGLIQDRTSQVDSRVPVLGDIPLLGAAFRDRQDLVEKTELIILLRPRVVRDLNEAARAVDEYRRQIQAATPSRDPAAQVRSTVERIAR